MDKQDKIAIALISYGKLTAKYLPYFFNSLSKQSYQNFKVFVADNSEEEKNLNKEFVLNNKFDFELDFFWNKKNLGFARAYNILLQRAKNENFKYVLIINPDIILEQNAIEEMLKAMNKNLVAVCPKILKWDFENKKKTKIIDTCGIKLLPGLRFVDLGQGEEDMGQYDNAEILAPSGACGLFDLEKLESIKEGDMYFDERMFMYKEDCDLGYRLKLANLKTVLAPKAIIYHDRSAVGAGDNFWQIIKARKSKSKNIKKWSYQNQNLLYKKHWHTLSVKDKIIASYYKMRAFVFALIFEKFLLCRDCR